MPAGWFADDAPVLSGLLAGLGDAWGRSFSLLGAVRLQARLATTTGQFLDLAGVDFFGRRIVRREGEGDASLRSRLAARMVRQRGTRAGLIAAAADAGFSASVFEPARPADTGAYGIAGGLAWGIAGGWGSLSMPLTCFVVASAVAPVGDPGAEMAAAMPAGGVAWMRFPG